MPDTKESVPAETGSLRLEPSNASYETGEKKEQLYRHETIRSTMQGVDHTAYNTVRDRLPNLPNLCANY